MQDSPKAVWSIPYVSVASFFPSSKQNFIAYRSSKVSSCPDCIFEIHQLWQSRFSRVYSNCCCSCSFEAEILKIGQSSHKMYSNKILNFQESTTNLNVCTKKVWKLIEGITYLSFSWFIVLIFDVPWLIFVLQRGFCCCCLKIISAESTNEFLSLILLTVYIFILVGGWWGSQFIAVKTALIRIQVHYGACARAHHHIRLSTNIQPYGRNWYMFIFLS